MLSFCTPTVRTATLISARLAGEGSRMCSSAASPRRCSIFISTRAETPTSPAASSSSSSPHPKNKTAPSGDPIKLWPGAGQKIAWRANAFSKPARSVPFHRDLLPRTTAHATPLHPLRQSSSTPVSCIAACSMRSGSRQRQAATLHDHALTVARRQPPHAQQQPRQHRDDIRCCHRPRMLPQPVPPSRT